MLKSFTKQLLEQSLRSGAECPVEVFKSIREGFGLRNRDATATDVIDKMLIPLKQRSASLTIVIDGFDQLNGREQELLCKYVIVLMEGGRTRLLLSSQEENILAVKTVDLAKISLNLTSRTDLALLVDARMHQLSLPGRILEDRARQARIRETLLRKADGMLLWAALLLDLLGECDTTRQVNEIMTNVPVGLEEVYLACLRRTRRNGRLTCEPRILKWSAIASEPLSINVWQDLLVTDPETGQLDPSLRLSRSVVIRSGVGLIRWHAHDESISLIHHSVRQFIFSDVLTLLSTTSPLWQYFETKLGESTDDSRRLLPFTWTAHRSQLELLLLQMSHIDYCSGEGMQESTSTTVAAKTSSHEQAAIPALSSSLAVIKSHLFGKHKGLQHSTVARLRSPIRPEERTHVDRTLFAYAVQTWPESCRDFNDQRDLRGNLARFALRVDRNANIFPWALQQPRTISTLLQGMFAHAVLSNHMPLLDLAIEHQDDWPREALDLVLLGNNLMTPLHFAAKFSQPTVFRRLWQICRHDIKCLRTGKTVLQYAAEAGNSVAVSIILSEPRVSLLNHIDAVGRTALHYAVMAGNLDTVELLLSSSTIQPNIEDNSHVTAMGLAIRRGQRDVVSMLLKYSKVSIERAGVLAPTLDWRSEMLYGAVTRNNVKVSALEYALSIRKCSIALDIVRSRRSTYSYSVQHGTILHMAVKEDAHDLAQAILEIRHIKLRWYDTDQRSPLYYAIKNNNTAMTKLFLDSQYIRDNLILERKGPASQPTLSADLDEFYLEQRCSDAVEVFIQGVPAEYYDGPDAAQALTNAARYGMRASTMVKLVQRYRSRRHQRGLHDHMPLFSAVGRGNVPIIRILMAKDPHDLDHFHPSLLESYSILPFETDMEQCEADAYCDEDGKGPVSYAAACGKAKALQYLLRTSFARSLNHPDSLGRTPLYHALRAQATNAVRVLLAAPGIDLSIVDKTGKSLVDWSILYGIPFEIMDTVRNAAIGHDEAMRLSLALTEPVDSVGSQSIIKQQS